jgi:hypothetical protein
MSRFLTGDELGSVKSVRYFDAEAVRVDTLRAGGENKQKAVHRLTARLVVDGGGIYTRVSLGALLRGFILKDMDKQGSLRSCGWLYRFA